LQVGAEFARHCATSVCGPKLLVYEALNYYCRSGRSSRGTALLVYEALSY
jgi:hypothetical protein